MIPKFLKVALAVFLFVPSLDAQGTMTSNWIHSWGGTGTESGSAVAMDSSGNVYVAGSTSSFGAGSQDVLLLKYDPLGNLVWTRTWGGSSNDNANGVLVGSDGSIYVVGGTQSFGAGGYDVLVLKFASSGSLVWARTWGGGSFDVGYDIAFDQSGNLAIAAESYSFGACTVLIKMSTDGAVLSASTWKGPANYDSAYSLTIDGSGNAILTGISWDYSVSPEHNTILVLKYDAQGNLLWNRNWAGTGEDETNGRKTVRTDSQGNIFIVGRTCVNASSCDFDALVLKMDPNGNLLWSRKWGGEFYDTANGLWVDSSNNLEVVGSTADSPGQSDALIQQYDSSGNLLISKIVTHPPIEPNELLSLTAGQGQGFVATGYISANAGASSLGLWQDTNISATNASGSLSTPTGTVSSPTGSLEIPQGAIGSPIGVVDNGDGGQSMLVASFELGSTPPNQGVLSVQFSPLQLVFQVADSTLSVTATNTGNADLQLAGAPYLSGPNWTDFKIATGTTCANGSLIPPSQSCVVDVSYSPLTDTSESATLNLSDNAGDSPQTVSLSGTLQAGGSQITGILPNPIIASSLSQPIEISGIGLANGEVINWADLTYGGTGTITPSATSQNQLWASITSGDETATWQFQLVSPGIPASNCAAIPNSNGTTTVPCFTLQVLSSDKPHSYRNDYLFQNAPYCPVSTSSSSCLTDTDDPYGFFYRECTSYVAWRVNRDFGTADPRSPAFLNKMGNGTWEAARHWNTNALALGYVVDSTPAVGSVAQWVNGCGGNCSSGHVAYVEAVNNDGTIDISEYNYTSDDNKVPSEPGDHEFGIRTIAATAPNYYIHVRNMILSGQGLNSGGWSFGNQQKGIAASHALTISNPGSSAILIATPVISGANTGDFQTGSCSSPIPAKSTCTITVIFTPSALGPRQAKLSIVGSAGTQVLSLTGTGVTSLLLPPFPSFGDVSMGQSVQRSITLDNKTGAPLNLQLISTGSTEFSVPDTCGGTPLPMTLAYNANAKCTITVTFAPAASGQRTAMLTVQDDALNPQQTVNLSGVGVNVASSSSPRLIAYSQKMNYPAAILSKITHLEIEGIVTPNVDGTLSGTANFTKAKVDSQKQIGAAGAYVKVIAMIGVGTSSVCNTFATIANSYDSLNNNTAFGTFITAVTNFISQADLDGVDIDWEPECGPVNFSNLIPQLRASLGFKILSIDVKPNPGKETGVSLSDFSALAPYVDYLNIMGYDYYTGSNIAGPNAPLCVGTPDNTPAYQSECVNAFNDQKAIAAYLPLVQSPTQINLGVPFYGRDYTKVTMLDQKCASTCVETVHQPTFKYIETLLSGTPWQAGTPDSAAQEPYLLAGPGLITYDDANSISLKANYAYRTVGGTFMWILEFDDDNHTLLNAVYAAYPQNSCQNGCL